MDPSLVEKLEGHETIITSVADLMDATIMTGDDRRNLRIWELNSLRRQKHSESPTSLPTSLARTTVYSFQIQDSINFNFKQLAQKISID